MVPLRHFPICVWNDDASLTYIFKGVAEHTHRVTYWCFSNVLCWTVLHDVQSLQHGSLGRRVVSRFQAGHVSTSGASQRTFIQFAELNYSFWGPTSKTRHTTVRLSQWIAMQWARLTPPRILLWKGHSLQCELGDALKDVEIYFVLDVLALNKNRFLILCFPDRHGNLGTATGVWFMGRHRALRLQCGSWWVNKEAINPGFKKGC